MSVKTIICVTCPVGCEMTIEYDNKNLISVAGNDCKRGINYASDEITNPRRTLTSTVVLSGAKIKYMPVKTSKPIAKDKLFEAMREINKIKINAPVKMGDVVYADITESGINLVAGRDAERL